MIGDDALVHIMSKQSHHVRKKWLEDRTDKLKGLNVADKNLKFSRLIDRLNEKIKGDYEKD